MVRSSESKWRQQNILVNKNVYSMQRKRHNNLLKR